jgi:hypothetical protein
MLTIHDSVSVTKENKFCRTDTWALDIHEEGVGVLHQALQLVLALFVLLARVQEVFGELQKKLMAQFEYNRTTHKTMSS